MVGLSIPDRKKKKKSISTLFVPYLMLAITLKFLERKMVSPLSKNGFTFPLVSKVFIVAD